MTNYIKHAQSLTREQWRNEIWISDGDGPPEGPLWKDILREIDSFPRREPMISLVKNLNLDTEYGFNASWIIHSVNVSEDFCSFPMTAYFTGSTEQYKTGRSHITGVEPIMDDEEEEREIYVIGVEAILHINDNAQMSSELVEAFTETDPDRWTIDWENPDGWLFAQD
jgi:hypothetical protein